MLEKGEGLVYLYLYATLHKACPLGIASEFVHKSLGSAQHLHVIAGNDNMP